MERVVPVGALLVEAGGQQPVALDHYLRIGGLHREDEVVKTVLAANAGKFESAFNHAQRGVAVPVHDPVAEGSVIGSNAQGAIEPLGFQHQRREAFLDPCQFFRVGLVGVFFDRKLFAVGVIAWVDANFFYPFDRFHRRVRLEMDVRYERNVATDLTEFLDDIFEVGSVLHGRSRDSNDLAPHGHEFQGLPHAFGGVHGVAGQHRLLDHRVITPKHHAAAGGVAHSDVAGGSAAVTPGRRAILHESLRGNKRDVGRRRQRSGESLRTLCVRTLMGPASAARGLR